MISPMAAVNLSALHGKFINSEQHSNAVMMWFSSLHIGFIPQGCQFDPGGLQGNLFVARNLLMWCKG